MRGRWGRWDGGSGMREMGWGDGVDMHGGGGMGEVKWGRWDIGRGSGKGGGRWV